MKAAVSSESGDFSTREFPMTDQDFERIVGITQSLTGITLSHHKRNMVYGRLARRLRRLEVKCFADYCDLIENHNTPESTEFINAITTNLTSFFREDHHFEYLKNTVIPRLIRRNAASKRIRVWSAGCSTGEEPYSIAMIFKSFIQLATWDVKILATDLDSNVLQTAAEGIYGEERAEGVPQNYRKFMCVDKTNEQVKIAPHICEIITFKHLNLLEHWPMKGPFDIIFCRNVVIYFNIDVQRELFERYANILIPHGNLFIGHSESLHNVTARFVAKGRTIYEKSD